MTPDDITRLSADISEVSCAVDQRRDPVASAAWKRVRATLAQQGKAGGPIGIDPNKSWPERDYLCKCTVCDAQFIGHKRQFRCRACTTLPANPPEAGVTDEMVERVWMAATGRTRYGKGYERDGECMTDDERADIRAALTAPQPKDAT